MPKSAFPCLDLLSLFPAVLSSCFSFVPYLRVLLFTFESATKMISSTGKWGMGICRPDVVAIIHFSVWSDSCKDRLWQKEPAITFWSRTKNWPFFIPLIDRMNLATLKDFHSFQLRHEISKWIGSNICFHSLVEGTKNGKDSTRIKSLAPNCSPLTQYKKSLYFLLFLFSFFKFSRN